MEQVLLVVQVLIAVGLILMVLIQRSDSDGFGLGSGGGNNLLSGRGTANLMTRTTAILAAAFIINSLALSILAARGHQSTIIETIEAQQGDSKAVPSVPLAGDVKAEKKTEAKKEAPAVDEKKPAEEPVAKKPVKKPVVKPADADANAGEGDHNE